MRQYAAFTAGKVDDADEVAAARSSLRRFIDDTVRSGGKPVSPEEKGLWPRLLAAIRTRQALAGAAALAALILIVTLVPWQGTDRGDIVLRGDDRAREQFELPAADMSSPERIALHWPRVPGADSYRVVIYDASFGQLISAVVVDTMLALPASDLNAAWQSSPTLQWEVEALRHGDVLTRSQAGVLRRQ
jgi:hypothetical protein